jgi:hypothetical protein
MKLTADIFDISNKNALVRIALEEGIIFDLSTSRLPKVSIPKNYVSKILIPVRLKKSIEKQIDSALEPLVSKVEKLSGHSINFYSAAYEAALNAYQHGNVKEKRKKIIIAQKIDHKKIGLPTEVFIFLHLEEMIQI